MKIFRQETITLFRKAIEARLSIVGHVKTVEIRRIIKADDNLNYLPPSTICNIFKSIMDIMVAEGHADVVCNGRWNIMEIPTKEISMPLLETKVDKLSPAQEVWEATKVHKGNPYYPELVIAECTKKGISVNKFIDYVKNQRRKAS